MLAEGSLGWLTNWLVGLLPPYTEQWATTYLQVLFQSFLFALGVPTAIYSLIVDNDIKRVAQTRVKARRYIVVTALLYAAVCIIVWFLHPEPAPAQYYVLTAQQGPAYAKQEARPAEAAPPAAPTPAQPSARESAQEPGTPPSEATPPVTDPQPGSPSAQGPAPGHLATQQLASPKMSSIIKSIFAAITVTFLPLAVLITGLWLNNQFKREKVVDHLASELLKSLNADRNIDTVALRDLSYLGEHGHAGDEKEIVLDIIDRLAEIVQKRAKAHTLDYNGYELESLIRHIPDMLDNASQPGNDRNFHRAVEVLANIWRWLSTREVSDDALSTREALRRLALRSVERMAQDTSFAYLEIAAECDSHMVFEMGLAAIKAGKYPIAAAALSKLETMASSAVTENYEPDVAREIKANLLGIAAHLAANGTSGALRAETTLHLNEKLFSPSLRQALGDAFDYHYEAGRFDIADKVRQLAAGADKMKTVDLDRSVPPAT